MQASPKGFRLCIEFRSDFPRPMWDPVSRRKGTDLDAAGKQMIHGRTRIMTGEEHSCRSEHPVHISYTRPRCSCDASPYRQRMKRPFLSPLFMLYPPPPDPTILSHLE